jgi:hypothetical protein
MRVVLNKLPIRSINIDLRKGDRVRGLTVGGSVDVVKVTKVRYCRGCLQGCLVSGNWTALAGVRYLLKGETWKQQ